MKKLFLTIIAIVCCFAGFASGFAGKVKINIILKTQSDATELRMTADAFSSKAERRDFVVNTLKNQAKESQKDLLNYLNILEINGIVEEIRPLWIVNSVCCYAEESLIDEILQRDDVLAVYKVEEFSLPEEENIAIPVERGDGREIAENIVKVNADQVWALGYTGEDVLVAIIDTGVRLDHADLQGRFWDGGTEYPNGQLINVRVENNRIDVSNLPAGVYLLKIDDKFVKIIVKH